MEMRTWRDARARAEEAAAALHTALTQLGLPERALRSIGPVVTPDGQAYVRVGRDLLDSVRGEEIAEAVRIRAAGPEGA
ncbi:hypothetical protein [Streptomyces albipurpureus]|uniref:Uncharacterized protein n=1 Tax=Streptomyces albipurpureus TaxID=2897419 RepID=A0ABT0UHU8_9ACTN|nr:hypothetical protein [Streptomyces sp. CWNU-1]MCM2387782.1 hypothetical protein [Streptomyces sp. CWNU-1]